MAKLYFYYSTMNAGKSTALLQAGHNYEERGMRTLLYTAQLDHATAAGSTRASASSARRCTSMRRSTCARRFSPSSTRRRWPACWSTNRSS